MSFHSRKLFLSPIISSLRDQYFKYVTLLLHGNGNTNGNNNIFQDSSLNTFGISRAGRTSQGAISPYNTNWSNYFNGSSYLSSSSNAAFAMGTGDFTVEAWIYITGDPIALGDFSIFSTRINTLGDPTQFVLAVGPNQQLRYWSSGGIDSISILPLNQWVHVACTRTSGTVRLFINGVFEASGTDNGNKTRNIPTIGANDSTNAQPMRGYISNLRVVKSSLYPTSSNFTPSTSNLTPVANTSLLTCQSNNFKDNSTNNFTLTQFGIPFVQQFSPFQQPSVYSTTANGGSGTFGFPSTAGSNYLSLSLANSRFNFTSGTFTIEFFIYLNKNRTFGQNTIISNLGGTTIGWSIGINTSNQIIVKLNGSSTINITGSTMQVGSWNHVAVSGVTGSYKLFVNGIQQGSTYTGLTNLAGGSPVRVGADSNSTINPLEECYLSNLRVTSTNVYTTNFSIPTYPVDLSGNGGAIPSNIPGSGSTITLLLLNFTNGQIFDNATKNIIETTGSAQIKTAIKKYGTGSMNFVPTSSCIITAPAGTHYFGTGDFTIEFWLYPSATSSYSIIDFRQSLSSEARPWIYTSAANALVYMVNGGVKITSGSNVISASAWTYCAIVRSSGNLNMYLNGNLVGGPISDTTNYLDGSPIIGLSLFGTYQLNGYIDDLRITKGIARSIVTPTAQFPDF